MIPSAIFESSNDYYFEIIIHLKVSRQSACFAWNDDFTKRRKNKMEVGSLQCCCRSRQAHKQHLSTDAHVHRKKNIWLNIFNDTIK